MPNKDTAKIASALKYKKLILLFVVFLLTIGSVLFFYIKDKPKYQNVDIAGQNFKLEIANTDGLRVKGLSGRSNIEQNGGMLFDFGQTGNWSIWMKDMNFNIDVIWLDQNGKVLHVLLNLSPDTYPQSFYADKPSRYIVELPAGTIQNQNVQIGDIVQI